jgi:hypothetical protein
MKGTTGANVEDFDRTKGGYVCDKTIHPRADINMATGVAFKNLSCNQKILMEIGSRSATRCFGFLS